VKNLNPIPRRKIIKKLKAEGFSEVKHNGKTRGKGSHTLFKHENGRTTTVPNGKEVGGGEVRDIEKQTGLKLR
jgi:predicted RNA binding protein YcfA (HicA-like mRNA interferase family)